MRKHAAKVISRINVPFQIDLKGNIQLWRIRRRPSGSCSHGWTTKSYDPNLSHTSRYDSYLVAPYSASLGREFIKWVTFHGRPVL